MKTVQDIQNLKGAKVLLRVDFDVPVNEKGEIEEPFRIQKQKAMVDWLVQGGAHVTMVGHISAVPSFAELVPQLHILLGREFDFIKSVSDIAGHFASANPVVLLDNVRQNPGEEKNDEAFAKQLSSGFNLYINNAFAVCHRNHASVSAITKFLPSYAGLLVAEEVKELGTVLDAPAEGKVIIMGGAKASTKVPVIKNLINKAEHILLGGVVANDALKEKGQDMGSSLVDADASALLKGLDLADARLVLPTDFIIFDNKILDIGDATMKNYMDIIGKAKMIIWNGPMGLFENKAFARGTEVVAEAIAQATARGARTIIGGGDSVAAVSPLGLMDKFSFVSTGGGAMLAFLAGQSMPALDALK